ncbi:hypothetical protein SLEP1_g29154 [Rubroshorea leprosula]|uniref:Reverse transcriptase zinc-binding domain-containing protein n=1 Tax=Rubroshorea leprosula TaxID=152421 RepID=A0AAV5JYI4_9ROSI|nr:hypothetical protein SLEP1_g29154 [Rubroshorea leprosula]
MISKKLDKLMVNEVWLDNFPSTKASFLPPGCSDHCAGLVEITLPMIKGCAMYQLCKKLKVLKPALKKLNTDHYGDIQSRLQQERDKLHMLQLDLLANPREDLIQVEHEQANKVAALQLAEESFFRQKSRVKWLQEGDSNIAYFHKVVKIKRMKNTIIELTAMDGRKLTALSDMEAEAVQFYKNLLGTQDVNCRKVDSQWLKDLLQFQLPEDLCTLLTQPVTATEIKAIVFNSPGHKAHGPDGYTAEFFKASWAIVANASWGWRKILKLRQVARKLIKHVPVNGMDTYIWHDHWHPCGPLLETYGDSIVRDTGIPSQAKLACVISGNFWKWPSARSPQLVQIQMHLFSIWPKQSEKDQVLWVPSTSRSYKAGQTWNWLRRKQGRKAWHKLIWFYQAIPKHSFISWLAILNRLTTKVRQKQWTPTIADTCILCNGSSETNEHLFFKCNFTSNIWQQLCFITGIPFIDSWQSLMHWLGKRIRRKSLYHTLIKLTWNASVYHVWMERNRRFHQQVFKSESALIHDIQIDVRSKILGFVQPKSLLLPTTIARNWGLETIAV